MKRAGGGVITPTKGPMSRDKEIGFPEQYQEEEAKTIKEICERSVIDPKECDSEVIKREGQKKNESISNFRQKV